MEFSHVELDAIEYGKLNEINYSKQSEKKEIIQFLAEFTFKIYANSLIEHNILLNEDIESLYFKILTFIKTSNYRVPKTSSENIQSAKLLKLAEDYRQVNADSLSDEALNKVDTRILDYTTNPLSQILEFRYGSEYGMHYQKGSVGYHVFLEFKRKILNKNVMSDNFAAEVNYHNVKDFEEYYLDEFKPNEITKLKYLNNYKKLYEDFYNKELRKINNYKTPEFEREFNEISKFRHRIDIEAVNKVIEDDFPDYDKGKITMLSNFLQISCHEKLIDEYCSEYHKNLVEQSNKRAELIQYDEILEFIKKEISTEKLFLDRLQNTPPTAPMAPLEIPEYDHSDSKPLERMILLEKLGIIKYIQSIQRDDLNEKQTAEILSSFVGINSNTIAKNLGVMLGYKKDDSNANSPYKNPKNLQLAQKKYDRFDIDEERILK